VAFIVRGTYGRIEESPSPRLPAGTHKTRLYSWRARECPHESTTFESRFLSAHFLHGFVSSVKSLRVCLQSSGENKLFDLKHGNKRFCIPFSAPSGCGSGCFHAVSEFGVDVVLQVLKTLKHQQLRVLDGGLRNAAFLASASDLR
jgi:hypothetical protein